MNRRQTNIVSDYFWNVAQHEEWRDRYIPRNDREARKQQASMDDHKMEAIALYEDLTVVEEPGEYKLSPNQNITFDGDTVYIALPDERWDKLIQHGKQPIKKHNKVTYGPEGRIEREASV